MLVRNFREGDNWIQGKIVDQLGPVSYLVQSQDGAIWRRHIDHIQELSATQEISSSDRASTNQDNDETFMLDSTVEDTGVVDQETTPPDSNTDVVAELPDMGNETSPEPPTSRYPKGVFKPPDRYK